MRRGGFGRYPELFTDGAGGFRLTPPRAGDASASREKARNRSWKAAPWIPGIGLTRQRTRVPARARTKKDRGEIPARIFREDGICLCSVPRAALLGVLEDRLNLIARRPRPKPRSDGLWLIAPPHRLGFGGFLSGAFDDPLRNRDGASTTGIIANCGREKSETRNAVHIRRNCQARDDPIGGSCSASEFDRRDGMTRRFKRHVAFSGNGFFDRSPMS